MLKIKGLKKKKKGKKNKRKEEELFEAAELEQYRREHQRKESEGTSADAGANEESEEWQKFKALTSGVDDILKKTQGDLDRIKSTSFFQRKPPGPSVPERPTVVKEPEAAVPVAKEKKWINFEEGVEAGGETPTEARPADEAAFEKGPEEGKALVEEEEEEEEETEEEDDQNDIFDTSYVDVVASGEVKLAYIPDSPTQDETGFDPFDTSIVEKVIKVDPNEKKRNLVSLGSAVQVLTGKVEKAPSSVLPEPGLKEKRRRVRRAQDLLLGSFDQEQGSDGDGGGAPLETPPKSILDEDPVFEEETSAIIGLPPATPILENKPVCPREPAAPEKNLTADKLLEEFVPEFAAPTTTTEESIEPPPPEEDLDDEFTALAAESLSKEEKVKPRRPDPPGANVDFPLSDAEDGNGEDDPFDTTFASKVLPGKFELKLIEKEILEEGVAVPVPVVSDKIKRVLERSVVRDDTFNEHNFLESDRGSLSVKERDLLGGSSADLSRCIGHSPIKPEAPDLSRDLSPSYGDPFDTSAVDVLAAPGKTELKFLEEELLSRSKDAVDVELDNDFDPRAEERGKPDRPDKLPLDKKRISVPKVVAFDVKSPTGLPDLLSVGQEENSKVSKPLTPYYPDLRESQEKADSEADADPFDTSFVTNRPGKVELKLLESELAGVASLKHSLSDPDFNPRDEAETATEAANPYRSGRPSIDLELKPDIISEDVVSINKLHTPVVPKKIEDIFGEEDDRDPFDTSIADDLLPGKAEIKILENELIYSKEVFRRAETTINLNEPTVERESLGPVGPSLDPSADDIYDTSEENISAKPLTPLVTGSSIDAEYVDPFDTSLVGDIVPGKTELKLLESELMSN